MCSWRLVPSTLSLSYFTSKEDGGSPWCLEIILNCRFIQENNIPAHWLKWGKNKQTIAAHSQVHTLKWFVNLSFKKCYLFYCNIVMPHLTWPQNLLVAGNNHWMQRAGLEILAAWAQLIIRPLNSHLGYTMCTLW